MHPQLVFVDVKDEDRFFLDSMRSEASSLPMSLFELPPESARRLRWLAKLDSAALAGKVAPATRGNQRGLRTNRLPAWNRIFIDILIQVTPGASGSLIRLLGSLSAADFRACSVPHITIELPPDPDSSILRFLENFQWPPADVPNPNKVRLVSVRHRIPRTQMTEEESSARFLELFWPVNPKNSHVLVLSPQAELAPQFYHCTLVTSASTRKSRTMLSRVLG